MSADARDIPNSIANSLANTVTAYTWLVVDVFIFLVVAVSLLVYKDLDESQRAFTRVAIVFLFVNVWISSVHILFAMRRFGLAPSRKTTGIEVDQEIRKARMLPWYVACFFPMLKGIVLLTAIWWLFCRKLL
jgi:hypothetical protein